MLPLGAEAGEADEAWADGLVTTLATGAEPQLARTSVTVNPAAVAPNLDHIPMKRSPVNSVIG